MHILFVSHSFPPSGRPLSNVGGMQRAAQGLLAALQGRSDVRVTPLVLRTSWRLTHFRVPLFLARLLHSIPRRVRATPVDVILFSSMVTASIAPVLRRRLGASGPAMVSVAHGRDVTLPVRIYQGWVPRVLGALDRVLAVSHAVGRACLDRGLPATKVRVIPNGIDPARFSSNGDRHAARHAMLKDHSPLTSHISRSDFVLLTVGRHVERKGLAWFVDQVMPRLSADVHHVIAGEGPETPAIRSAVARRGVHHRVHLLGRIADQHLVELYRGADLFVMPNLPVSGDLEGFGLVVAEAAMCGLPAVAADLEGIRDVVRDRETGTLVPSGDPEGFAEAIARYRDPAVRWAAGEHAARDARQRFAWPVAVEGYVSALADLGRGAPVGSAV